MNQMEMSPERALGQSESINLLAAALRFYRSIQRRKLVVLSCLALSGGLGAFHYTTAERLYQSRSDLIVLSTGGEVVDQDSGSKNAVAAQMPNFERVLQSDNVLKEALKSLPQEHRVDFENVAPDLWLERFRNRLKVSTMRNTNVISMSFRSTNPETAYIVVGSLLDSYLLFLNSMHQDNAQQNLSILINDKVKTEQEIRSKEEELLRLKRDSQVLFGSNEQPTNVLSERVLDLNRSYLEARKQTISSRALWISIQQAVQNGEDLQEFAIRLNETLGTRLLEASLGMGSDSALVQARMQQNLVETRAELSVKQETLDENHPVIKELKERIRVLESWLQARPQVASEAVAQMAARELGPKLVAIAARQYQVAYNQEQEILQQYIQERDAALQIGQQLAEIELLQNEVATMRNSYNMLLETIKEKSLAKESSIYAKPITPPSIDHRPVTPKLSVTGLLSVLGGLVLGGLSVYVLDFFDDRFHSPDDLRQTLNTTILAMVRKLPVLAPNGLESLYPYAKPNSVESEAFRTLRTAIDFSPDDLRRLTISSTEPSDGKTTVMASLGVAFAQAGKRTLLIDGDMRRPGTTRLFDLVASQGLSSVLRDERPVWECVQERIVSTGLPNLDVLPSGPRPVNPVELLAGDRLAELIAWAETQYDQLLIDAPPSLAVADVQVIGRLVDAAILTVRPDKNRRKMVIRAAEALTALGCRMVGLVVNHVDAKHGGDYAYGYGYGYGYGEGYGHDDRENSEEPLSQAA